MKELLVLLIFSNLTIISWAQSPLDVRLDFVVQGVTLTTALNQLDEQARVGITFNSNIIPSDSRVTLHLVDKKVGEILILLLKDVPITFEVVGEQIILIPTKILPAIRKYSVSGYVSDTETGERIIGANVYDAEKNIGTISNEFGFFSLMLPEGQSILTLSYIGYQTYLDTFSLYRDIHFEINLSAAFLSQVEVNASLTGGDSTLVGTEGISSVSLSIENMSRLPSLGGETDVVRLAYLMPGVQTGADGFGGIAVRGGNVDQNLFLLDGVPIYNPMHAVGLYSVYNTSAIRSAKLLKGGFPAKYGGRTSSVLDVQTKEGNFNKHTIEVDMGLTSGKLTVEGPLKGKNSSFFISGRRAFFDFYSRPITTRIRARDNIEGAIGYFFYDFNLKTNYKFSKNDHIYVSYYKGIDDFTDDNFQIFQFPQDTVLFFEDDEDVIWGNEIASFRWNHVFNNRLFCNTTLTYSRYFYESQDLLDLEILKDGERILRNLRVLRYGSNNKDYAAKIDFDYSIFRHHFIEFGASAVRHRFQPGVVTFDQEVQFDTFNIDNIGEFDKLPLESFELDAYLQDEFEWGHVLKANLGVRASAMGVTTKTYYSIQPRINLEFFPTAPFSFHSSVGKVTQHLHLLSPTSIGLPKDLWVSSTARVRPQESWQYILGFDFNFLKSWEIGVEAYYKTLRNLLAFNDVILDNINSTNWQNQVSVGKGEAYGVEFFLQKQTNKMTGWLSYTLSWSNRQFNEEINNGKEFPFRLDRRHNLNLVFLHRIGKKMDFSASWVFSTGAAFTLEEQTFDFFGIPAGVAPSKNNRRLPNYHRLDLGINIYLQQRKVKHIIKLGTYNTYNRYNPIYITIRERFDEQGESVQTPVQVSLVPIFPALRYVITL